METMMPVGGNPPDVRRRGQTLAEFAISLPILLLLLFGILEFGRLFQSWVTLQNAARTAARYTITGAYNDEKYDMDFLVPCYSPAAGMFMGTYDAPIFTPQGQPPVVYPINVFKPDPGWESPALPYKDTNTSDPLLLNAGAEYDANPYRTYNTLYRANGSVLLRRFQPLTRSVLDELGPGQPIRVAAMNKDESLYSTWYGLKDCAPTEDALQFRKDLMRLASIYDEARRGAAGLALETSLTGSGSLAEFKNFLYNYWSNPSPRQEMRAWFNVMICSARPKMYSDATTEVVDNLDGAESRFYTSMDDPRYPGGGCFLKERPLATSMTTMTGNHNRSWADPGGPGERITIVITYNHPLITPLGLAKYVQIQARRSAVNESFKVTSAERVLGPSGAGLPDFVSPTPLPPTETPTVTDTPGPTETFTATPSASPSPTRSPFDCSKLKAGDMYFDLDGRSIVVKFENFNDEPTDFTHARVTWPTTKILTKYPSAYFAFSSIESDVHWVGNSPSTASDPNRRANVSPIDSLDTQRGTFYESAFREIDAQNDVLWKGTFLDIGERLGELVYGADFAGTIFYFRNPEFERTGQGPAECAVPLQTPPPPPEPTAFPPGFVPSATHTPDCADRNLTVQFVSFDALGDVRLRVTNMRAVPGYLIGFTIYWPTRIAGLRLSKVTVGGANANDVADPVTNPSGTGKIVWQNLSGGASTSPTLSHNTATGSWLGDYIFPPSSITDVHLDFTGSGPSTLQALGVSASEFNGTNLRIQCTPATANTPRPGGPGQGPGTPGANGAPGTQGDISFVNQPTPVPTTTPRPTNTPGPTLTPSKTPTKGPPTNTWTPAPPTKTFTPSPTGAATKTKTPTPTPTDADAPPSDGG